MSAYQHILCATDFSAASDLACSRARELARCFDARLTLLHVVEYFPEDRSNAEIPPEDVDPEAFERGRAEAHLAEQVARTGCQGAATEVIFSTHSARHGITPWAEAHGVDLIVLGSHGHHGVWAVLGSTAIGVAHRAPCDLLAVRAG